MVQGIEDDELNELFEAARNYVMSPEEQEEQRRSFAYGNGKLSNPLITRKMIDEAAERIDAERMKRTIL